MNRSKKVANSFSKAAESYDQYSLVQRFSAQKLATKVLSQEKSSLGVALEVGCGTGILSQYLASKSKSYVLSDISFSILNKAKEKINNNNILPLIVDGEHPCFTASFDVIVSHLVLHWFQDPKRALTRLIACLKPGGRLYISTLGTHSFHEWRATHSFVEAPCGLLDFISFGQLKDWLPLTGIRHLEEDWMTLKLPAIEFLRRLKSMGGALPHPGHQPLPYRRFKQVMEVYNQNPQISCQILYATYQKPEKMEEE